MTTMLLSTAPDTTSESLSPSPVSVVSSEDALSISLLSDDLSVATRLTEQLLAVTPSPRDGSIDQWAQGPPLSFVQPSPLLPSTVYHPLPLTRGTATGGAPKDIGSLNARNIDHKIQSQQCIPSRTLWVGNVCSSIKKAEFKELFGHYGEVQLIRHFPQSHCAFVTYMQSPAAVAALRGLEGLLVGSMKLTLTLGQASRHVWIGNVCGAISETELYGLCSQHGTVESFRILRINQCAFVNFYNIADATRVADQLNGYELYGTKLVVNFQWATPPKRGDAKGKTQGHGGKVRAIPQAQAAVYAYNKVLVPQQVVRAQPAKPAAATVPSEQVVAAIIAEPRSNADTLDTIEATSDVRAPARDDSSDKENEQEYPSYLLPPQPAKQVVRQHRDGPWGRPPRVQQPYYVPTFLPSPPENPPNRQLYVGNLSPVTTEQTILDLFNNFGVVEAVRWYGPQGFCFVRYSDVATAQLVRFWMDVCHPIVDDKPLIVRYGRQPKVGGLAMSPEMQHAWQLQMQQQSWYAATQVSSPALSSAVSSPAPAFYHSNMQFSPYMAPADLSTAGSMISSPLTAGAVDNGTASAMLSSVSSPSGYSGMSPMFGDNAFLQSPLQFPAFIDLSALTQQSLAVASTPSPQPHVYTPASWMLPEPVHPLLQRLTSGPHSLLRPTDLTNPMFNYPRKGKHSRQASSDAAPNLLLTLELQRQRNQQQQLMFITQAPKSVAAPAAVGQAVW